MLKTKSGDVVGGGSEPRVQKFMRRPAVMEKTGLSTSTIYELMDLGKFPRPVKISHRVVAWLESDIAAWQADRIAQRDAEAA